MEPNVDKKQLTKKQHFVPQFYLRKFTNTDGELHIFDAQNRRRAPSRGPSGVCHDQFFYAEETGNPDALSQEIEEYFSNHVEDPLSNELPLIIENIRSNKQITDEDKYTLAIMMNNMWLRGPAMRDFINRTSEQMIRRMNQIKYSHESIDDELRTLAAELEMGVTDDDIKDLKEMVLNDEYELSFSNVRHLQFMLETEHIRGFTNLFHGQYWILHINKTDRRFITTSNPVTVILPARTGFYGASFIQRTHLFPLAPDILIETCFPVNMSGKKIKRQTHFVGNELKINELNLKMAGHAQYVYSSRSDEIDWLESYVKYAESVGIENLVRES